MAEAAVVRRERRSEAEADDAESAVVRRSVGTG